MLRRFLAGTYTTQRASRGLYLCSMDERGRVAIVDVCAMTDPSFVVLHPHLPLAYVVNETPAQQGDVSIVEIDGDRLIPGSRVSSEGNSPCHLALLADASALVVSNYGCGTIGVFGLDAAGQFSAGPRTWRHQGASVDTRRQASAHPHCVVVGRQGVYVTDLGQDCVVHYAANPARRSITLCDSCWRRAATPVFRRAKRRWVAQQRVGQHRFSTGNFRRWSPARGRLDRYVAGGFHRAQLRQRNRTTPERSLVVCRQSWPRFDRVVFDWSIRRADAHWSRVEPRPAPKTFRDHTRRCCDAGCES